jgi:hypothetical protein
MSATDPGTRTRAWVRAAGAGVLAILAAVFLVVRMSRRVPLHGWFFFDLATIWAWGVVFVAACTSAGAYVVGKLLPTRERTAVETVALSFSTGVVVFMLGMYAAGAAHLYGRVFAVAFPALLLATTIRPALAQWRELRASSVAPPPSGLSLVLSALGVLGVGVLYLGAMTPAAINYDAGWVHMVIAQDYARAGHLIAFPGDQVKAVPHLGAMLTTWGFLVPGLGMPALRWMMALHIELAVFVMTLVGIAALARWLAQREVPATWTALMLFPGIFVYDGNIAGASDHFLASFAAPVFLGAAQTMKRFDRRAAVLFGILAGGALTTKIQAIYVLCPIAVWAVGHVVVQRLRARRGAEEALPLRRVFVAVAIAAGAALVVQAPHFISNIVFYRNPVYPLLQDIFTGSRPTVYDAAEQVRTVLADWNYYPPAAIGARILNALELAFTFSFVPHYSFVGNLPAFGSVFTLALPLVFFVPRPRRVALGAAIALGAVFMWAMSYLVDRNLQTFLPLLVAATAAILVRAWELGWFARAGICCLVVAQVAWALPLYVSGSDRINDSIALLKSGMDGSAPQVLRNYRRAHVDLGKSLPADAVVVLHTLHDMLGIDRDVLMDFSGFQMLIDYRGFKNARDLYDRLREVGATHVVWQPGRATTSMHEEVIFDVFAQLCGDQLSFGNMIVASMPTKPPPAEPAYKVLSIGVPGYPDGLYAVNALGLNNMFPPAMQKRGEPLETAPSPAALIDAAKVVVVATSAQASEVQAKLDSQFQPIQSAPNFRVWLRK